MIDHMGIGVKNYEKSKSFYIEVLKTLGYDLLMEYGKVGGFGANGKACGISTTSSRASDAFSWCARPALQVPKTHRARKTKAHVSR